MDDLKYEITIRWCDEDSAFIAEMPELPGCVADGQSQHEALDALKLVANEWIDTAQELGRSVPSPKGRLLFS